MSERDDYLFDPAAKPDPEVAALERALAPLRWREVPLRAARPRRAWPLWLAAAAVLAAFGWWAFTGGDEPLRPNGGKRVFASASVPRTIALGDLAEITLLPDSELAFVHWRPDEALFTLARGGLVARVEPPPKVQPAWFRVDTPQGRVIDQGCRYELSVRDGAATVRVTEGAVTFVGRDRTVFVPAGASAVVEGGWPLTPSFDEATAELRKAVREYDEVTAKGADLELRSMAVKQVLAACRERTDSLVLWHLLRDGEPMLREAAEAHLIDLVGTPIASKQATFDPEEWLPFLRLSAWQRAGK